MDNCKAFARDMDSIKPELDRLQHQAAASAMDLLNLLIRTTEADSDGQYTLQQFPELPDKPPERVDADLGLLGKVWDTVLCCSQHGVGYSEAASNDEILRAFDPVVNDVRHMQFADRFGKDMGGILLADVAQYLETRAKAYVTMNGCPSLHINPQHNPLPSNPMQPVGEPNFSPPSDELDLPNVPQPFLILSAHDDTLMALLGALGAADALPLPWFAAHVALRLTAVPVTRGATATHRKAAQLYLADHPKQPRSGQSLEEDVREVSMAACPDYLFKVEVTYNGEAVDVFGCGGACTLRQFVLGLEGRV